jgi:hypothetical protein
MMKKVLLLTLLFATFYSQAQFPIQQSLGSGVTQVYSKGGLGADSGFVLRTNFTDTAAANRGFIKNIPGIVIRNIDTLWQRNNAHTAWIKLGAGSGSTIDTSNKWITTAYKRLDSVFIVKGGNEIFAYKDAGPINQADGLIVGGVVTWTGTGLVFGVTPATYVIDGSNYTSLASSITLDAADGTFGRYDAIIVNSSGVVSKITGTPAASPVFPQIDPATELLLTYVLVDAGATTPTQVSDVVVYDENVEWTTSTTGGVTADFANTTFANHGTKSIAATWAGSSGLLFTNGSSLIGGNYLNVSFYIRLTATMANNVNVALQFYNGSTAVSNTLNCAFSKLAAGWQLVSFNISQFTFNGAFNRIRISLTGTNASTVYFDWLRLQANATPQPTQGLQSAYTKITDGTTTAAAAGSDQIKFRHDNTMSVTVGSNDATHGDNVLFKVDTTVIATKYYVGSASNLQAVTDAGNTTTNTILANEFRLRASGVDYAKIQKIWNGGFTDQGGALELKSTNAARYANIFYSGVSNSPFFMLPETGQSLDTLATLFDIRSGGGGTPTLTSTRIGFGSGSNLLTSSGQFTYDTTNVELIMGDNTNGNGGNPRITMRAGPSQNNYIGMYQNNNPQWFITSAYNDGFYISRYSTGGSYQGTGFAIQQSNGLITLGYTPNYVDNAAALAGGLVAGQIYRNGDVLMIVH